MRFLLIALAACVSAAAPAQPAVLLDTDFSTPGDWPVADNTQDPEAPIARVLGRRGACTTSRAGRAGPRSLSASPPSWTSARGSTSWPTSGW